MSFYESFKTGAEEEKYWAYATENAAYQSAYKLDTTTVKKYEYQNEYTTYMNDIVVTEDAQNKILYIEFEFMPPCTRTLRQKKFSWNPNGKFWHRKLDKRSKDAITKILESLNATEVK